MRLDARSGRLSGEGMHYPHVAVKLPPDDPTVVKPSTMRDLCAALEHGETLTIGPPGRGKRQAADLDTIGRDLVRLGIVLCARAVDLGHVEPEASGS